MEPSHYLSVKKKYGGLTDLYIRSLHPLMKEPNAKKNACWETVRIISIIISLIGFTEKVVGSNPYSPNTFYFIIFI